MLNLHWRCEKRKLTLAVGQEEGKPDNDKEGLYDGLNGCSVMVCVFVSNWKAASKELQIKTYIMSHI